MYKLNFKSSNGALEATIICRKTDVDKKTFEGCSKALLQHLSAHLSTYRIPEVFHQIIIMRQEYLNNVLKLLVEISQACGGEIPSEIRDHLVTKEARWSWDPEEEQEN